jgi:hypothetical protein
MSSTKPSNEGNWYRCEACGGFYQHYAPTSRTAYQNGKRVIVITQRYTECDCLKADESEASDES